MKLTNTQCKNAKYNSSGEGNKLSDGGGLYLQLSETGKYWRMNYRFLGKQKTLAIGTYPLFSLAEAREKRDEAKKLIAEGVDPATHKKLAKLELRVTHNNSFENIAREWHAQKKHTWKPAHAAATLRRLETNIFPHIGTRPIKEVTPPELLSALRTLESEGKRDLAHRQLQHCSQIFRYAIATGRAKNDVTPHLKGALQPTKSKGLAYLQEHELPEFLAKLGRYDTDYRGSILTKLAFQLMILTFVRSGEIRGARWEEINWEKAQWKIPAERMKMNEAHIIPLSKQSLKILKLLRDITGRNVAGYIFPSHQNPRSTISENTFLRAIEVMGYKGRTTGHGFRSTASTILNENGFRREVIERQLAHAERDTVRAAYNHAEYLPERATMMQWWADYIDTAVKNSRVVERKFTKNR
ncbi:MAG: tyrosine-type recombinase/integrase [Rickettsiales bacterium]